MGQPICGLALLGPIWDIYGLPICGSNVGWPTWVPHGVFVGCPYAGLMWAGPPGSHVGFCGLMPMCGSDVGWPTWDPCGFFEGCP